MELLGSNQFLVSIIVTKKDTMPDYDVGIAQRELAKLLMIDLNRIFFIGNDTNNAEIITFLKSMIVPAQVIELTEIQKCSLISQNCHFHKCNLELDEIDEKLKSVKPAVINLGDNQYNYDSLLLSLIKWLIDFRDKEKQNLFQLVEDENEDAKIMLWKDKCTC